MRTAQDAAGPPENPDQNPTPALGLYVHWPFCQSKCPYCDFNSHVTEAAVDHSRWRAALIRELQTLAARLPHRQPVSLFFGGGTPSLMDPETVAALLTETRRLWPNTPDGQQFEVTLEANPGSVETARLRDFRAAGVNRLSLGIQSLDDAALQFLGRRHDAAEARAALAAAQDCFERVSFDLIYARPGQTVAEWQAELQEALTLAGEHLSLYQLTIEPSTAFFGAHRRGEFTMPDDEAAGALYEVTQATLAAAGRPAYEISNHARPGAECRHNLVYWRGEDYLGIGPGAHSRIAEGGGRTALRTWRAPAIWLERTERDGHALQGEERIAGRETLIELLMMGMRLTEGIARTRLEASAGMPIEALFEDGVLARLAAAGYLHLGPDRLVASAAGRQRLDSLLGVLIEGLRPPPDEQSGEPPEGKPS